MEHDPFKPGVKYEHGVGHEVKKEDSQKILDLLESGPKDYPELRDKSGLDDQLITSVLNLLQNRLLIEKQDDKFVLKKEKE